MAFHYPIGGGSGGGGVTSLNTLTGALNLVEGAGIDITTSGSDITIAAIGANVSNDTSLAVKVATTAALPGTPTYNNGTAGVGATLTRSSNGTTGTIDGVTAANLMVGDYILVKNQAAQLQNGVYSVTQQGSASLPYILTRVAEADTTAELDDLVVTAASGTTNKGVPYGQQTNNPVIGTNNIVFTATGIYMRQQTSGTQAVNQIPVYTGTALTQTKGTANFKYNPTNDLFTIRGIDYTFPADNGDASQVLTTDGSGNLTWTTPAGGSPGGSDTQIQYNNAGAFAASSNLNFDPETNSFTAINSWEVFRSEIKFESNGGPDDLSASLASEFTGTPPTVFYVLAVGNIQIVNYTNLVGGNFSQGDIITGSISGAQGTVAYDDGSGQLYVSITNSIQFASGDVIDNGNGVTADYDTSTTSNDVFFWFNSNGGSGGPTVITGSSQALNDDISITFGSTTGHGVGDSWEWSYKILKNTRLTNRIVGTGILGGAINGQYFKSGSGSSIIQSMNGFFQNGDDDRIFPLSYYEDLTGNNSDKERAYYGLNPFKNDPSEPLEFSVYTRKGIGLGPSDISTFSVSSLNGIRMESDKIVYIDSPLFQVAEQIFSWTGNTNGNGITIDDTNNEITLATSHTQQSAVLFTGSGLDEMNVAGSGYSGTTFPNTYTVQITQNNVQLWTIITINPGVFTPGEILTGVTSGETATFVGYAGIYNDVIMVSSVSGTFSSSEYITGSTSSVTQQFNFTYSTNCDAFTLTTSTGSSLGCTNSGSYDSGMGLDGVYPQFTSFSGYTVGDSWTWTYSYANQNVLDFSNNDYKFQSTFGTDTFGYQISDNLLGAGISGSVNTWTTTNVGDLGISGFVDLDGGFGINSFIQWASGSVSKLFLTEGNGTYEINYLGSRSRLNLLPNEFDLIGILSGFENGVSLRSGIVSLGNLTGGNNTKITVDDVTQLITISNVPTYADDAAAITGGLTTGQLYKTTTGGITALNIVP